MGRRRPVYEGDPLTDADLSLDIDPAPVTDDAT